MAINFLKTGTASNLLITQYPAWYLKLNTHLINVNKVKSVFPFMYSMPEYKGLPTHNLTVAGGRPGKICTFG